VRVVAGGEREDGEKEEGLAPHLLVPSVRGEMLRGCSSTEAVMAVVVASCSDGTPTREEKQGRAREVQGDERKLLV
jgi:hypothetical protein